MGDPKSLSRSRRLRLLAAGVPIGLPPGGLTLGEERALMGAINARDQRALDLALISGGRRRG